MKTPTRLVVALAMLFSLCAAIIGASTQVAHADAYIYDAPAVALVDVQPFTPAEARPTQLSGSREWSALRSAVAQGASTTPAHSLVATNTVSWRATNMSLEDSLEYHWHKHGAGKTKAEYIDDAIKWAECLELKDGTPVTLADGTTG